MKKIINSNGITLLSLVITIIILIIVIGVLILSIVKDDGIIGKAKWADFVSEYEKVDEAKILYMNENYLNKYSKTKLNFSLKTLFTNISYASNNNCIYPVDLTQKLPILATVDTLQQTIINIENLDSFDIFDEKKVNLYKVDFSLIEGIKVHREYVINIASGMLYYIDGEHYKNKIYHTPKFGMEQKNSDNPNTPVIPNEPIIPENNLTIHYSSGYDVQTYKQIIPKNETTNVTLAQNSFKRDGYTFMYWKDVTSKHITSTETSNTILKSGGYYDVVNNLVKILDEDWESDILDTIKVNLDYQEDPDDPNDAPNAEIQTKLEILDYLDSEKLEIQKLFTSDMTIDGLVNWMISNQDYLKQLQDYENTLDNLLYDEYDENEEQYEGIRYYNNQKNINMNGQDLWLEATWSNNPINLDANGGFIDGKNTVSIQLTEGQEYGDEIVDPVRENYIFIGWFTEQENGIQKVETDLYYPTDLPNKTLYAHWKKDDLNDLDIVQITFDANTGKLIDLYGNELSTLTIRKVKGALYGNMPESEKTGLAFDGWYTEKIGGTKIIQNSIISNSITLYAHYKESNIIKLDLGNTSYAKPEYFHKYQSSINIEKKFNQWYPVKYGGIFALDGKKIGKQAGGYQLPNVASGNYRSIRKIRTITTTTGSQRILKSTFNGWYTGQNGTGTKVIKTGKYYNSYGRTLYAYWKDPQVITYDANGGKFEKSITVKQKFNKFVGQKYPKISKPIRNGYTFVGWFDSPIGGNKIELANSSYTINGDITLYAHWEDKTPPQKFTISVSNLNTSGFTINVSKQVDSGSGIANVKYYINTSTSGNSYQTSNKVGNLGDSVTRYVWVVLTDNAGNTRRSTNYVKVLTPHVHNDSCYSIGYANYSCKADGNYKDTLVKAMCKNCSATDSSRIRAFINTNYNYTITGGYSISYHKNCGATNCMDYYNYNWTAKASTVYEKYCPQCGHNITDNTSSSATTGWLCRHATKTLFCTKTLSGKITPSNF